MSAASTPIAGHDSDDQSEETAGWSFGYGERPHRVYARELREKGGVIQVRYHDPSLPGRDKRARKHLTMPLRKRPDGPVDPKLERLVRSAIIAANARLVAGNPAFGESATEAPERRPSADATPETLTIEEGFAIALHPETGKYASTDTRRYDDMQKLRDILFAPGMLNPHLRWVDFEHEHVVALWRRMADIHKKHPERFGVRRAEVVIDALYTVASWLRLRGKLKTGVAQQARGWRNELREEWMARTGRAHKPSRPRHTDDEARAVFAALEHQERERYRALLRVARDGAVQVLHELTREHIVRDAEGQPIALRTYITREHRDKAREAVPVSVRIHLDDAARAAVREVDTDAAAADAPFFTAPLEVLTVDQRAELLTDLGAELRQGQVLRCRRSDLTLTPAPLAPHGKLEVHGSGKKKGETVVLTAAQRAAVDRALAGYLALAEAAYDPRDKSTDYYLFPGGKLAAGQASVDRARRATMTRAAALEKFHELERAAGVEPVDGRGWYGLRRVSTDRTPEYTADERVQDAVGGWTPGSDTRRGVYQDGQNPMVLAEAARVREAWRAGATPTTGAPTTVDALLAALPEHLRAAVLASLAGVTGPAAAGTAVGTNENGPGVPGP